jgi:membrane fusion protein (multidrug efflux system)
MPEMDETSVGRQRAPTILRVLWLFAQRLRGRMTATICLLTALCLAGVVLALDHGDHLVASMDEQTTDDAYVRADLVSIASHIGGYVESVPVADNERVEAGQTVAVIRSDDYKARLDAAEADLGAAQAAAETLNEQAVLQTSHISAAEAAVRQAEANLIQTRLEYSRQRSLATDGTTSRRALEEAHAAEQRLTAARDQAAADLTAAEQMQRVIQTQAEQARNTIASKRAGRDLARIDLGYTRSQVPFPDNCLRGRSCLATMSLPAHRSHFWLLCPRSGLSPTSARSRSHTCGRDRRCR